jgi:methionyl-tRNA formyltransferase
MKIVFMGTPAAAVPTLARLLQDGHEVVAVWTQPDKPAGRGNKLTAPAVKQFAVQRGLSVHQPAKIKTAESLDLFHSHKADAAVVVAYGRILPSAFLDAFPHGCINVHFSLLPQYRGAAPVNWAIVRGEKRTGVTTMQMDEGLDTGDVLLQAETEILPDETAPELLNRLSLLGADLLSETLQNLKTIKPRRQNEAAATFAPVLKREDGLLSWDLSAFEIVKRIRGFQPFPGSFIFVGNKKLTLFRAAAEKAADIFDSGTIVQAKSDDLFVACGENTVLKIQELQPEGKRKMTARDFLNGIKLTTGERLQKPSQK